VALFETWARGCNGVSSRPPSGGEMSRGETPFSGGGGAGKRERRPSCLDNRGISLIGEAEHPPMVTGFFGDLCA